MIISERLGEWHVSVIGLTSVTIDSPDIVLQQFRAQLQNSDIQILRADRIAGREHLQHALQNTLSSISSGQPRSRSIAMEALLHVSGERQISKALAKVGMQAGKNREVVILVFSKSPLGTMKMEEAANKILQGRIMDDVVEVASREKIREICRAFDISEKEILASRLSNEDTFSLIKRLVLERSALLSIQK